MNQFGNGKDEFPCRAVLADFIVDFRDDVKRVGSGIAQEDIRADRAEGIQTLAVEPLNVVGLQVSCCDVVEDSKTVDVIHGFANRDI